LRLGLRYDAGAWPALFIAALTIIISHPGRATERQDREPWITFPGWGRHGKAEISSILGLHHGRAGPWLSTS
jgi:hypothetical protein